MIPETQSANKNNTWMFHKTLKIKLCTYENNYFSIFIIYCGKS